MRAGCVCHLFSQTITDDYRRYSSALSGLTRFGCGHGSTVVEHSTHNLKFEGSNPATRTGGEIFAAESLFYFIEKTI
jgi:hypothetical protein